METTHRNTALRRLADAQEIAETYDCVVVSRLFLDELVTVASLYSRERRRNTLARIEVMRLAAKLPYHRALKLRPIIRALRGGKA